MKVPFMNLSAGIDPLLGEISEKIVSLIKNTEFIGGKEVSSFEEEFAAFCNLPYSVGCSNGTDALVLALKILNIGIGDTVLVPANTFIATSEAVTLAGAEVDFVDVKKGSWTLDPEKIEGYIQSHPGKKVKAVIPVHLYGRMANMPEIMKVAAKYGLKVIEDSAQAHGASIGGKEPGHWGDVATFSFYPGKNLGAFGDAGAIAMRNKELYEAAQGWVNHGRLPGQKYEHAFEGANFRLDSLQAAVLRIKLRGLRASTEKRVLLAGNYYESLKGVSGLQLPLSDKNSNAVFHLYVVHHEKRDQLLKQLKERGISAGVHYPIPLHLQPAYSHKGYKPGSFPVAEENSRSCLSLPLWPEMSTEEQAFVIRNLKELA